MERCSVCDEKPKAAVLLRLAGAAPPLLVGHVACAASLVDQLNAGEEFLRSLEALDNGAAVVSRE